MKKYLKIKTKILIFLDAHFALNQLTDFCNQLDSEKDSSLILGLNRLMNVFQSRLFLGLLGKI